MLSFAFRLGKRIARRQKVPVDLVTAVGGVGKVADLVCRLERTAHKIAANPDMSRPGQDAIAEFHVDPGLEAHQSALLDQVVAELTEAIDGGPVVAKACAGDHGQQHIGAARSVAVTVLEAEIDRPAGKESKQVRIRVKCRWAELGQNIHRRQGCRVMHQRQFDQRLDRAASELRPDPLVFASRLLVRRMRRPVDAQMPQVVQTHGNGTAALIEGRVQINAQARDGSPLHGIGGAGRQRRQALLRGDQIAGEELAFAPVQLQREGQFAPVLP